MFVLHPLLLPLREGRARTLSSEIQAGQDYFTDWMSFLPSNLIEEIIPNPEAVSENT